MTMQDPHKRYDQILGSMCLMCKHYSPKTEWPGRPTCPAFPQGIPDRIFHGEGPMRIPEPHLEPVTNQQGDTVFEPGEGVTEEMVKEWDGFRAQLMILELEQSMGQTLEDSLREVGEDPDDL